VTHFLGLPVNADGAVPDKQYGEIIVYHGGWSLQELRSCVAGELYMWTDQDWYDHFRWQVPAGYYRLRLAETCSKNIKWDEQDAALRSASPAWRPAPITVAATALLMHLAATGEDLLLGNWGRSAEVFGLRWVGLNVHSGRVLVSSCFWDGSTWPLVWLAQKC
jgi:hypothetical protein